MGNCYPSTPMKNKDSPLSQFSMFIIKYFLKLSHCRNIICTVWNKESHGLHDYESKNSNKQTFRVQFTGGLMKNKKVFNYCREDTLEKKNVHPIYYFFILTKKKIEEQNNKLLFQIQNTNSDYFLNSQSFNIKSSERLGLEQYSIWQVIKGVKEASQLTLV